MFLQRDPEGYEDSVNLYAGMRWDPVNLRDPTGRCVWEDDPDKRNKCWESADFPDAEATCGDLMQQVFDGSRSELPRGASRFETYFCMAATYAERPGVTVTGEEAKQAGADLHDAFHQRMVRLGIRAEYDAAVRRYGENSQTWDHSINMSAGTRRLSGGGTESILGRDVNRYLYGRANRLLGATQPIYEQVKKRLPEKYWPRHSDDPAAATGGDFYWKKGIWHWLMCNDRAYVPAMTDSDAEVARECAKTETLPGPSTRHFENPIVPAERLDEVPREGR
jgi:hypothetical protein